ncbi:MAG: hypothetical protein HOP17_04150 [Acidobacteria bacterium]|nr:hypothetical protein [Acidobacteriota bacterium]
MAAEPKDPKNKDDYQAMQQQGGTTGGSTRESDIKSLIKILEEARGIPISLRLTEPDRIETGKRLTNRFGRVTVAFPPCSGEMLALIKINGNTNKDDIDRYFEEYFNFGLKHKIISSTALSELDPDLLECSDDGTSIFSEVDPALTEWISDCCLCSPCLTLDGIRNADPSPTPLPSIKRLFPGDVVWLSFMERMGISQILGAILDAYACNGRLPISNGSLEPGIKDDIVALVLEVMTRQVKTGISSTVRDRACLYRTALGWTSEAGRKLNLDTSVNTGFNTLFHKLIYHSLEFYKDKRLAVAIRGTAAPVAPPSVATLITIRDTIDVLKKRFEAFHYGRNFYNTLSGIVWTIAGMSVIRSLATTIGIPPAFNAPDEFIPAAYDILVLKRPVNTGETNRYLVHKECADKGRDVLLDLEVIDHQDTTPVTGELEVWLTQIEAKIEGYRTAYRTLTGVDLGVSPTPVIEQQA